MQTDFDKVEQEAMKAEQLNGNNSSSKMSPEEQEEKLNSIKLAYQQKQRITENKLKSIDPNKANQLERLGMGSANIGNNRSSSVSHSAFTDMKVIEQVNPSSFKRTMNYTKDSVLDDLEFSSNKSKDFKDDDFWSDNGFFDKNSSKKPDVIDSITTIDLDRK